MKKKQCYIIVMAGGTGGHVYPALTIARNLIDNNVNIEWIGTSTGIESRIVPEAGIEMIKINMSGFAGKGLSVKLRALYLLFKNSFRLIVKFIIKRPAAVIGFGGYVSLPGAIAARVLFIPVLLHEQNSKVGVANKIVNKISNKTMLAFKGGLEGKKVIVTGNPIRDEICGLKNINKKYNGVLNVLVMGGSLGAKFFNKNIMQAFSTGQSIHVIHQCGQYDVSEIKQRYDSRDISAEVVRYINDVSDVYKNVDLVICRAGAMTVSELMCAAIPAVYIPYPYAIYNHQYHNALIVQNIGGGYVIKEDENTISAVSEIISSIVSDKDVKLSDMRKRLLDYNYKSGTGLITEYCLECC